jgi:hypothetical protein
LKNRLIFNLQSTICNHHSKESGGMGIRVALALGTLLVVGTLIATLLQNNGRQQLEAHRKAVTISEYGLQIALDKLQTQPSWTDGIEKTPYDGGWYSVSLRRFTLRDTMLLEIKSEGHLGDAADSKECLLARCMMNGDSAWAPRDLH